MVITSMDNPMKRINPLPTMTLTNILKWTDPRLIPTSMDPLVPTSMDPHLQISTGNLVGNSSDLRVVVDLDPQ